LPHSNGEGGGLVGGGDTYGRITLTAIRRQGEATFVTEPFYIALIRRQDIIKNLGHGHAFLKLMDRQNCGP
jgi:hypothetical protein